MLLKGLDLKDRQPRKALSDSLTRGREVRKEVYPAEG